MTESSRMERRNRLASTIAECEALVDEFPDHFKSSAEIGRRLDPAIIVGTLKTVLDLLRATELQDAYLRPPVDQISSGPINDRLLGSVFDHANVTRTLLQSEAPVDEIMMRMAGLRDLIDSAMAKMQKDPPKFLTAEEGEAVEDLTFDLRRRLRLLESSSTADTALTQINRAKRQAERSASKASTAAGKTGEDTISTYYQELADTEGSRADWYRRFTIIAGVLAGLSAAAFLVLPEFIGWLKIENGDYVHLIQRVIVTAAVLGVAGYLARQAHQHRSLANWAASLAVQLKTFEAYIDPIEHPDARNELRKTFASRAFGEHPALKGEAASSPSPAAMDAAVDLVAKVTGGSK